MDADQVALKLTELFAQAYLLLHRRRPRDEPTVSQQSLLLLQHLFHAGPLTIGDLALHIERAQSVVSETVEALEKRHLLSRVRDPRDRRRTLVWLTDEAVEFLARQQQVFDSDRFTQALAAMPLEQRQNLLEGFQALVHAAEDLRRRSLNLEPPT